MYRLVKSTCGNSNIPLDARWAKSKTQRLTFFSFKTANTRESEAFKFIII